MRTDVKIETDPETTYHFNEHALRGWFRDALRLIRGQRGRWWRVRRWHGFSVKGVD